jgi:hypothetical protein
MVGGNADSQLGWCQCTSCVEDYKRLRIHHLPLYELEDFKERRYSKRQCRRHVSEAGQHPEARDGKNWHEFYYPGEANYNPVLHGSESESSDDGQLAAAGAAAAAAAAAAAPLAQQLQQQPYASAPDQANNMDVDYEPSNNRSVSGGDGRSSYCSSRISSSSADESSAEPDSETDPDYDSDRAEGGTMSGVPMMPLETQQQRRASLPSHQQAEFEALQGRQPGMDGALRRHRDAGPAKSPPECAVPWLKDLCCDTLHNKCQHNMTQEAVTSTLQSIKRNPGVS